LLKLRKVDMLGFKSFCEKTHLTFSGNGITAIVGPNGCGKSNVVDAISWVLGEQSHKSLRAERMTDCIFNGTARRPPLGFAEVSLTLVDPELAEAAAFVLDEQEVVVVGEGQEQDPETLESRSVDAGGPENAETLDPAKARKRFKLPKPAMHLKPGEVVIGRRLYRSGQSEYLINGKVARLRDIQELFMGTGLGPESYAIIEQGRIGQILSSKPMDRRAIIEEAAGVSKYKTKRRLAEAKLESSRLNLARVNDILVEVEKQLGSLKRQASKARRFAEIREAMRGIQRTVLASKARELDQEAERIALLLQEASAAEHATGASLQEMEAEQERLQARLYELEGELRRNANLLGECALELDRAENRIGFNRERMREMDQRVAELTASVEAAVGQAAQVHAEAQSYAASVAAMREETQRVEETVAAAVAAMSGLQQEQTAAEERIAHLRRAAQDLGDELTRLHGEEAQAEAACAHFTEWRARAEHGQQQLNLQQGRHRECLEEAEASLREAASQAVRLEETVREEQLRVAELKQRRSETTAHRDQLRQDLASARARLSSLEQILKDRAYTTDSVQKLFAANGSAEHSAFRAVGLLADYAEVEERHEAAVEQFLRDELEYIVVETFDHARAGISMLRNEVGGRATFFVDSLNKLTLPPAEAPVSLELGRGVVARLDQLVSFREPLGPAAKEFLPRLRSAFLVDSAELAESLAHAHGHFHFVAPDGTCFHGRTVSGGRAAEAGPLAMKRELRSLETEVARLAAAAEQSQAALDGIHEELRRHERALEVASAEHLTAAKDLVGATHLRDAVRLELDRIDAHLRDAQVEIARLTAEAEAARRRAESARATREGATQSRAEAESEAIQAADRVHALRAEMAAGQDEMARRRAELAAMGERLAQAEAAAARHGAELAEVREREAALRAQLTDTERERAAIVAATELLTQQAHNFTAQKERLAARQSELEQEFEQSRVRTVQLEDGLRLKRQHLGDLRERRGQHEIERARNESDRNHLRETCLLEVNAHPEDLLATETALLSGEELAAADASYRDMKSRIEAMGAVNMMALEEYQECEQRFTFLSRERDDLVKSIEDTRATITELDETCTLRFQQAFEVINRNFTQAFTTLFGGGHAEMRLGEADSAGEPGIDIIASPPGKRLQNVLLLSGGEKALTAVSLLIAIFRYTPSPFCILDEVDAPLDEANVGRFNKLLAEMSGDTQFIIITHNRRTMEMAPVLYGVTMQEPGVSKMVSVRWEEAQAQPQSNAA
jgi:chromosome segregation protein